MAYFSGQGRVYLAKRDANGNPLNLRWVGNVPDLKITLNVETIEHKESYSGQRLVDLQLVKGVSGEFSCTLEDLSVENLEIALYGTTTSVTAGNVTGEQLATGVSAGDTRLLANQFVSSVVVRDSSATPKTLPAAQYTVLANQGAIVFNDVSTGGPYVQPFKVDYAYGAAKRTAMFKSARPELWLRFDGINTADDNKPVVVDLYRVAINPTRDLSLIGEDLQKFELSGLVLADTLKPNNGPLGMFGRMILQG